MNKLLREIKDISLKIYDELGAVDEDSIQVAMSIELSKLKISHLRETTIQVYYDGHPLRRFELDFLISPHSDLKKHLIIETKLSSKISDEHRQQLRNYLRSAPLNNLKELKEINMGLLINFKKTEKYKNGTNEIPNEKVDIELWQMKNNQFQQIGVKI